MMKREIRKKTVQRERIIEDYRASGLSGAEYCRQKKLPVKTFYYWVRKSAKASSLIGRPGFIQINRAGRADGCPVVIETPGGYRIEVQEGTRREFLRDIIQAVGVQ